MVSSNVGRNIVSQRSGKNPLAPKMKPYRFQITTLMITEKKRRNFYIILMYLYYIFGK